MISPYRELAKLNWRGRAARAQAYFQVGRDLGGLVNSLLITGTALKVFGVSTTTILWIAPIIIPLFVVAYTIVGFLWVTYGWYRQLNAISLVDNWAPQQRLELAFKIAVLESHGIDIRHLDLATMSPQVLDILAVLQQEKHVA